MKYYLILGLLLVCSCIFMLSCKQVSGSQTQNSIPQSYLNNKTSSITQDTWHTEGGTIYNDNYGDISMPKISGLQWSIPIEGDVLCGPVIDNKGSIWCGVTGGRLIQLKNGILISDTQITQQNEGILSITLDANNLYAIDDYSSLYRIDISGTSLSIVQISLQPNSVAINAVAGLCFDPVSNTVFANAVDGYAVGCSMATNHYWCKKFAEQHISTPVVFPGGLSLMIGYNGNIVGIDINGNKVFQNFVVDAQLYENAADHQNECYYVTQDNGFYCMSCAGKILFNKSLQNVKGAPAIGNDGTTVWSSRNGSVISLDKNGNTNWEQKISDEIWMRPCIDRDGNIYIADRRQTIYQLSSNGDILWSASTDTNPWEIVLHEEEGLIVATRTTVEAYR